MTTEIIEIEIPTEVLKELEYIVKLHKLHDAPNPQDSVHELIRFVLASIADGSRRPGSWEREILIPMGLIADCDEHDCYRSEYGRPAYS
ncbi:hypothetical protein OURE66S_03600 [Oligella ureolytica]